jgi:hypothetical protein
MRAGFGGLSTWWQQEIGSGHSTWALTVHVRHPMCVRCKELVCPCTPVLGISVKANDHPPPITSHTYIHIYAADNHAVTSLRRVSCAPVRGAVRAMQKCNSQHMHKQVSGGGADSVNSINTPVNSINTPNHCSMPHWACMTFVFFPCSLGMHPWACLLPALHTAEPPTCQ